MPKLLLEEDPKKYFLNLAVTRAQELGYEFTPMCLNKMDELVTKGVRVFKKMKDREAEKMMGKAEKDLIQFVDAMVAEARRTKANQLQESNFAKVRDSFCPCPPWCNR